MTIIVRYRTSLDPAFGPAFSSRNFRSLSMGGLDTDAPPGGFADAELPVPATAGATLAETIYLSGLFTTPSLCSGIGTCGLCRVRYLSAPPPALEAEERVLSHHDLDAGWRLACRRAPEGGARVLIPAVPVPDDARLPAPERREPLRPASLAVDLGTTSVAWRLAGTGTEDGEFPYGSFVNPQMGAGSDVISRIALASSPEGARTLARLTTAALRRLVRHAEQMGYGVEELCVAANPAMTAILLGKETSGLARSPYTLPLAGDSMESIPGLPPVYVPPLISPFVGGDAVAGYAALALDPARAVPEFPFLLVDIGTNGECILALSPGEALTTSVPMGPALEGINLRCGMTAGPGAVLEYALTPHGLQPKVRGDTAPAGIAATGYLTLLRSLRAAGILTEEGAFANARDAPPLAGRVGGHEGGLAEPAIRLPGKMLLTASDVEEILKVKAAFSLAVSRMLREAGVTAASLRGIYLSGALGSSAPAPALTALGFLPPGTESKVTAAGNTALDGAALLLRDKTARAVCARWAENATPLDLAGSDSFGHEYARHMVFAWRS